MMRRMNNGTFNQRIVCVFLWSRYCCNTNTSHRTVLDVLGYVFWKEQIMLLTSGIVNLVAVVMCTYVLGSSSIIYKKYSLATLLLIIGVVANGAIVFNKLLEFSHY